MSAHLYALAYDKPLWIVALLMVCAMMLAREFGAAIKRRILHGAAAEMTDGRDDDHIVTAVLGLLALLIAFTFGLALDRYETRRELVVKEAKALDAAYLRTAYLPDPEPLRQALRLYTVERLRYGHSPIEAQGRAEIQAKPAESALWAQTIAAVEPLKITTPATALHISTPVNEALDAALERRAILSARLPKTVLGSLTLYAIVSAGILGYAIPGVGRQHRVTSVVLFGLISLAMSLILDLDRPRTGSIRVPQAPMEDALDLMSPAKPAPP